MATETFTSAWDGGLRPLVTPLGGRLEPKVSDCGGWKYSAVRLTDNWTRQLDPQRISRIQPSSPDGHRTPATCTRLNVTSDCFRPQDPEALYLQARRFAAPRAACLRSLARLVRRCP